MSTNIDIISILTFICMYYATAADFLCSFFPVSTSNTQLSQCTELHFLSPFSNIPNKIEIFICLEELFLDAKLLMIDTHRKRWRWIVSVCPCVCMPGGRNRKWKRKGILIEYLPFQLELEWNNFDWYLPSIWI